MSTARIDKLLREGLKGHVPVPHKPINGIKEDPISKRLRKFDNTEILFPFPSQSGIYINTNELRVNKASKDLTTFPNVIESMHIGFSGWHNFDIMAQRKSSRALICDINPENAVFLYHSLKYLRLCNSREQFIQQMTQFIKSSHYEGSRTNHERASYLGRITPESIKFCFNISEEYPEHFFVTEEVSLETKRETSWLYTDERYSHIRALALTDKIAVITESICASDVFFSIRRLLMENAIYVDTVYVSNIGEWMSTEEQRHNFLATVAHLLMDNETVLLDAKASDIHENTLPFQRCTSKRQLEQGSALQPWFFSSGPRLKSEEEDMVVQMEQLRVM